MEIFFEFEKPIVTLEKKLQELREIEQTDGVDFKDEIKTLEKKLQKLIQETKTMILVIGVGQSIEFQRMKVCQRYQEQTVSGPILCRQDHLHQKEGEFLGPKFPIQLV